MMKVAASSNTDIAIICAGKRVALRSKTPPVRGVTFVRFPPAPNPILLNDAASASVLIETKDGDNIAKVFKESSHGQALEVGRIWWREASPPPLEVDACSNDLRSTAGPTNHEARAGTGAMRRPASALAREIRRIIPNLLLFAISVGALARRRHRSIRRFIWHRRKRKFQDG